MIGGVGDNVAAFLAPAIIIPWHLPYNWKKKVTENFS